MIEYGRRLLAALLGRTVRPAAPSDPAQSDAGDPELRARVSALAMDLAERDRAIDAMRQEYAALQVSGARAATGAGQDHLERLFKKLAGPMSNLSALAQLFERGKDVTAADLVSLFHAVEKELARAGMERVGTSGDGVPFDAALHQRMSGGAVHVGTPVTVRVPGYRVGDRVLVKAMVSGVVADGVADAERHDG